jgi:hypothetical protein
MHANRYPCDDLPVMRSEVMMSDNDVIDTFGCFGSSLRRPIGLPAHHLLDPSTGEVDYTGIVQAPLDLQWERSQAPTPRRPRCHGGTHIECSS